MDALFVFPTGTMLFGVPLGIAKLAACLRQSGAEVKIIDLRYQHESQLITEVNSKDYKIIGIYSSSEIANVSCELLKKIENLSPHSFFVVGGPHATLDPKFFLEKGFDIILKGESERTIVEVFKTISKINNKNTPEEYNKLS